MTASKVLISSSPKLFEPVVVDDAGNIDAWGPVLGKLLEEHVGTARGDLIYVLLRRGVDGHGSLRLPDGQEVRIHEWLISVLIRWTGTTWEGVFPFNTNAKELCP